MAVQHFNQVELSRRWRLSPRTLERWRSQGIGPQYLKVGGRVVYRLEDIETYEAEQLRDDRHGKGCPVFHATASGAGMSLISTAHPVRIQPLRLTEIEFCAWIAQALTGDRLVYHRGFLAFDVHSLLTGLSEGERDQLRGLGTRAFTAAEQGLVHLVQERLGPDRFAYIAIARPRPEAAAVSLSALLLDEREAA